MEHPTVSEAPPDVERATVPGTPPVVERATVPEAQQVVEPPVVPETPPVVEPPTVPEAQQVVERPTVPETPPVVEPPTVPEAQPVAEPHSVSEAVETPTTPATKQGVVEMESSDDESECDEEPLNDDEKELIRNVENITQEFMAANNLTRFTERYLRAKKRALSKAAGKKVGRAKAFSEEESQFILNWVYSHSTTMWPECLKAGSATGLFYDRQVRALREKAKKMDITNIMRKRAMTSWFFAQTVPKSNVSFPVDKVVWFRSVMNNPHSLEQFFAVNKDVDGEELNTFIVASSEPWLNIVGPSEDTSEYFASLVITNGCQSGIDAFMAMMKNHQLKSERLHDAMRSVDKEFPFTYNIGVDIPPVAIVCASRETACVTLFMIYAEMLPASNFDDICMYVNITLAKNGVEDAPWSCGRIDDMFDALTRVYGD